MALISQNGNICALSPEKSDIQTIHLMFATKIATSEAVDKVAPLLSICLERNPLGIVKIWFPSFLLNNSRTSLIIFRHVSDNTYLCTSFKEVQYNEKVIINSNRNGYAVRLTDGTG